MNGRPFARFRLPRFFWVAAALSLAAFGIGFLSNVPPARDRLRWRIEIVRARILDVYSGRSEMLPTPRVETISAQPAATAPVLVASYEDSEAAIAPPLPAVAPTTAPFSVLGPPPAVTLTGTRYERQKINNCGPATLAMALSYWGWQGDQTKISDVLKPATRDKNVRWDELVHYVQTRAGWLDATFRVGGTADTVKLFVANGYPVIIETSYTVSEGWVGHYLLMTGYDNALGVWIVQDATGGPDRAMPYADVDRDWQQFNRLFILVFPPADREKILFMLGPDADETTNRQRALDTALAETQRDPQNAFAWFNLGSNLNYFDRYAEAAEAFDEARTIGLPWRMLFYQFGPYRAYFNVGRYQDVFDLADATLDARPDLEESFFWRGWARYVLGDPNGAVEDFRRALEVNPGFDDARAALESIGAIP